MNIILINFYNGTGCDNCGRTLNEILAWNDTELEETHDFIQFVFPLKDPSRFNPDAPLLDSETIQEFRSNQTIKDNVCKSLVRIRKFYDISNPCNPHPVWMTPLNHNYMRLTRILKSLCLLGFEADAQILLYDLNAYYKYNRASIGDTTMRFWNQAVKVKNEYPYKRDDLQ